MLWKIHENNQRLQTALSEELGVSPLFAQLLVNRNLRTPDQAKKSLDHLGKFV